MSEKTNNVLEFRFRYQGLDLSAAGSLLVESHIIKPGNKIFFKVIDELPDLEDEVKSGYNKKIVSYSENEFAGSLALRISHISFNSKVVLLTRRRETDNQKIYDFLKDQCSQEELNVKIESLKEYPEDWTNSTEDNENHPISIIESVIDRINTVEQLEKGGKDWGFPIAKSGLCLYILFTCIETLAISFVPYNSWLQSRKKRTEVEDAIDKNKELPIQEFLEKIHEYYLQRYGMVRAIKEFFQKLDPSLQKAFINSITVYYNEPMAKQPMVKQTLGEAIDFLLDFRNSFSHGFVTKYSIPTYSEAKEMKVNNYSGAIYMTYQEINKDGSFHTYMTSNLLGIMKLIVKHALWNWIKSQ